MLIQVDASSLLCLVDLAIQAFLWYAENLKLKFTLEEHSMLITDVRFTSSIPRLATSSFDKTVKVWDADNVSNAFFFFFFFSMITAEISGFC